MTIEEARQTVDQWINTLPVRFFSELTNQTGVSLTDACEKNI